MIIRNIMRNSRKINLFRKSKKISQKIYVPVIVALILLGVFGSVLFTPMSDFFGDLFYASVMRQFNPDAKLFSGVNLTNFVMALSYPAMRIDGLNPPALNNQDEPDAVDVINNGEEAVEREDNAGSIYQSMPIVSDKPAMSIYEYYESMSGAKIIETAAESGEIPAGTYKITPINSSAQKNSVPQLLIQNQTSFNIDLNDFLTRPYPIKYQIKTDDKSNAEPLILILCTHATESYYETGTFYYSPAFTGARNADINKNVVLIASELKITLEKYGVPVIQSLKIHDEISYQNSYMRSLETMNAYLQEYPSIKYVIDVHRDSMITQTGEKYKPTININGKNAAQIMMVVGTSEGGAHHPDWTDNLTFAAYMQQKLNDKYPMLARPINLRSARFNQHVTKGSIILEVGSCGNSFDEALYSAKLFGECLAELIVEQEQGE